MSDETTAGNATMQAETPSSTASPVVTVQMRRTENPTTPDQALWSAIRKSTNALSFNNYNSFMDVVMCGGDNSVLNLGAANVNAIRDPIKQRLRLPFPDTDERLRDADSIELLRITTGWLAERGLSILHVDATVVIERPAISPHREAMRDRLAEAMGIGAERVNVKATRGEGMGFVGRQEGAAGLAVATLER